MSNHSVHWQGMLLGRYRLLQLLGKGAMGEVWLAEDSQLRRQVAMKLLPPVLANDQNYLHLFAYEARASAALEHPHILAIHDFGEEPGSSGEVITYLVMPYITGGTLRARIRSVNGLLPTGEALHYLRQAAQAIDYAHSRGVIHRDIKPANMLLQQYWLWLSDFGIAKLLTSNTYRSQTSVGAGTPEFIAPEQAQGHAEPASDRYSLAIIAYQMFCGQVPFKGDTSYSTMIMHIRDEPPAPRQFNPQLTQAVERVILKGIAKSPAERYASCTEFVQALERAWKAEQPALSNTEATVIAPWSKRLHSNPLVPIPGSPLQDRPSGFTTRPVTHTQQPVSSDTPPQFNRPTLIPPASTPLLPPEPQKDLGRRKLLVGGATAAAALLIGGGGLGTYLYRDALFASRPKPAPAAPGPHAIMPGQPVANLTAHTDTVWNVVWDPTGRYLATAGEDTHVMLWDVGSTLQKSTNQVQPLSKPLASWKFANGFFDHEICWSADGQSLLVTAGEQNKLYIIDALKPNSQPRPYTNLAATQADPFNDFTYDGLAWRPGSNTFTTVNEYIPYTIEVGLWNRNNTQAPIRKFTYDMGNVPSQRKKLDLTSWSIDGSMLAGLTLEAQIIVWDGNTGKKLYFLDTPDRANGRSINFILRDQLAWSPVDTHTLLAFDLDTVAIWDVRKPQPILLLGTDDPVPLTPPANKNDAAHWIANVAGIAWSPNGRYIVGSYAKSSSLYIWDVQDTHARTARDGTHLQTFMFPQKGETFGHSNTITDVAWSPDGRYIASASIDHTIIVWRVDRG